MKNWRHWSCVLTVGLGLLFSAGCESNSDDSDADEYFKNNPYQSAGHDDATPMSMQITPVLATLSIVGQEVLFTGKGGTPAYKWSVTDPSKGQVEVVGWSQCRYVCLQVGNNTVRVEDEEGHFALARVTPVQDAMTVSPATVALNNVLEAAFTVNGGSPPYVWSVGNPALGTVSYSASSSYHASYHGVAGAYGNNIVTVRDAEGRTAYATVTQSGGE